MTLSLPFSWQMFYFGSIFFAISSFVYSSKCPYLIQKYHTPDEYWNSGHGLRELTAYALTSFAELDENIKQEIIDGYEDVQPTNPKSVASSSQGEKNAKFFYVQENTQYKRKFWRGVCASGYLIGAIFFLVVLVQNFTYVFKQAIR